MDLAGVAIDEISVVLVFGEPEEGVRLDDLAYSGERRVRKITTRWDG
jgi:hypothetical protein